MSHKINAGIKDIIRETVSEIWKIEGRADLEADCCDYVFEKFDEDTIKNLVIEFLSSLCYQALSSQDHEHVKAEYNKSRTEYYKKLKREFIKDIKEITWWK